MRTRWTALALSLALVALGLACGKKGPPLPPLQGMTPRVIDLEVSQAGRGARATFTLPIRPDAKLVDYETRGVELWRREARPQGTRPVTGPPPRQVTQGDPGAPLPPDVPLKDFTKGATLVASVAGSELFDFLSLPVLQLIDPSLPTDIPADGLEYAVILKSDVRASGTVSNLVTMKPLPAPDMPTSVVAEAIEGAVRVSWTAATHAAPPPSAETEIPEDASGKASPPPPSGPIAVNVYRAVDGAPFAPEPIEGSPFKGSAFTDDEVISGTTYRYILRSVTQSGDGSVESDPSPEVSAQYRDVFSPASPKGLRVIPEAGRVNLVWNPSAERDLGGYHVYRRPRGGEWQQLDTAPLPSATFTDRLAPVGTPLEYAVTAHDTSTPPNESEKSAPLGVSIEADDEPGR